MSLATPMRKRPLFTAAALASLCVTASSASAALDVWVYDGTIQTVYENDLPDATTVDHYFLNVITPGTVSIDTRSWEIDEEDRFDNDSNFQEDVDLNGDGEIAFIDSIIYLFADPDGDGNVVASDLVGFNDEDGTNSTYNDGSIENLDAYLGMNLPAGRYVLAIGTYDLTPEDAAAGFNTDDTSFPLTSDGTGNVLTHDHGDYRITFSGNNIVAVPEPASLAVVTLGVGALFTRRRRRTGR